MLKEAQNEVFIEGVLNEVDFTDGISKKNGKAFVRGVITIQVDQVIDEVLVPSAIPVKMFAMKTYTDKKTKQEKPNPAYAAIMKVKDTFTSLAAAEGIIAGADCVRVRTGKIAENVYVPKGSDKVVTSAELQGSFVDKISHTDMSPLTRFEATIVVNSIRENTNRDGDPTGGITIAAVLPRYGGRVDLIDFKVYKEAAVEHITQFWNKGDTVRVCGILKFDSKTIYETKVEEGGFGEPIAVPKTISVSELVITSGSGSGLEGELAYDKAELNEALAKRLVLIEEKMGDANKAPAANNKDF